MHCAAAMNLSNKCSRHRVKAFDSARTRMPSESAWSKSSTGWPHLKQKTGVCSKKMSIFLLW